MTSVLGQRRSLMFRARSYMAFVFTPAPPIVDWLAELDANIERSRGFFAGHPVALDLSAVNLSPAGVAHLVASLEERNIRILGIEGYAAAGEDKGLPPLLRAGRNQSFEMPRANLSEATASDANISDAKVSDGMAANPKAQKQPPSLLVDEPVRSGQTVVFIEGDVTVVGSVSSGAEIVAGGSIHIYGTLRGRAMAGAAGNSRARIFCHRVEAELLAIDSFYKTADDIEDSLRHGPAQAWLERNVLRISALN